MPSVFSSPQELSHIQRILSRYVSLPFSTETIPGAVMEAVLANVRGARVLRTYDFVDVVKDKDRIGWQVKSTKASTPVTWKRAKIPNQDALIRASHKSAEGVQALGDAIIAFCNDHAVASMKDYDLQEIGYARLILHDDGQVTYFEKRICSRDQPFLFRPQEFRWKWSKAKKTVKKEQLQAFHGVHYTTGSKWWAWHGLGENQLHFSSEREWWPASGDRHTVTFKFPPANERMPLESFMSLLDKATLKG